MGGSDSRAVPLALQDFKVGNLLGKGSFAGVYRAVSLKTGLEVAIKMVRQPARGSRPSQSYRGQAAAGCVLWRWAFVPGHSFLGN